MDKWSGRDDDGSGWWEREYVVRLGRCDGEGVMEEGAWRLRKLYRAGGGESEGKASNKSSFGHRGFRLCGDGEDGEGHTNSVDGPGDAFDGEKGDNEGGGGERGDDSI